MKMVSLVMALFVLPVSAEAQIIQDNIFGDNIVQQNVVQRPVRKVVKKVVRNGPVINNNTYIINEAPAPVTTVTTTIIQRPPVVRYVYPNATYIYPAY